MRGIRKLAHIGIAMAASIALTSCGASGGEQSGAAPESQTSDQGTIKIGYVPSTMNNPFWQAILDGLQEEVDGKATVQTVDPQADQAKMNDMVGDLIASGVQVLVIGPYDTTGVKPALEAAKNAGVPVVNIDTPVDDQDLVETVVASDNQKAGKLVAKSMMEKLEKGSKVAVLHCPAGQACIDRLDGFREESGDYFEIVQELDGKGELATSMTLTEDILQSDPDVAAIFGVNDPMALGAVQALQGHPETAGKILVYGVDGSPDGKTAIANGNMAGTGAQSPINIGKQAAQAALMLVDGKKPEKNYVIDTMLIDKSNVDKYGTDSWQ